MVTENRMMVRYKKMQTKKERKLHINRFNPTVEEGSFLNDFQKILLERLILSTENKYNKINVVRAVLRETTRNPHLVNPNIRGGFLMACTVEADFYFKLQELIKDLTGKYSAMDEFIMDLLVHFYLYYTQKIHKREKKNISKTLFIKKYKGRNRIKLNKIKKEITPFYHNCIKTWNNE